MFSNNHDYEVPVDGHDTVTSNGPISLSPKQPHCPVDPTSLTKPEQWHQPKLTEALYEVPMDASVEFTGMNGVAMAKPEEYIAPVNFESKTLHTTRDSQICTSDYEIPYDA